MKKTNVGVLSVLVDSVHYILVHDINRPDVLDTLFQEDQHRETNGTFKLNENSTTFAHFFGVS